MPIHVGILCERCRKAHFVATSSAVEASRRGAGLYELNCPPPCGETKEFRKEGIRAFGVPQDALRICMPWRESTKRYRCERAKPEQDQRYQ
jgi:hypothetical protein